MAEYFAEIRKIYEDYLEKTEQLERNRKLGEGIFGSAGPKTDPCHSIFAETVKLKLDAAARDEISSAQTREILEYMLKTPTAQEQNQLAYWMLLAVAKSLLELFERLYPKHQWLPVQKQLVNVLKARQKG